MDNNTNYDSKESIEKRRKRDNKNLLERIEIKPSENLELYCHCLTDNGKRSLLAHKTTTNIGLLVNEYDNIYCSRCGQKYKLEFTIEDGPEEE